MRKECPFKPTEPIEVDVVYKVGVLDRFDVEEQ